MWKQPWICRRCFCPSKSLPTSSSRMLGLIPSNISRILPYQQLLLMLPSEWPIQGQAATRPSGEPFSLSSSSARSSSAVSLKNEYQSPKPQAASTTLHMHTIVMLPDFLSLLSACPHPNYVFCVLFFPLAAGGLLIKTVSSLFPCLDNKKARLRSCVRFFPFHFLVPKVPRFLSKSGLIHKHIVKTYRFIFGTRLSPD
jgi:hypothetical protein